MGEEEDISGGHQSPWYLLPPITTFHVLLHRTGVVRAGNGTRFPAKLGPDYDRFHRRLERPQEKLVGPSNRFKRSRVQTGISFLPCGRERLQGGYLVVDSITSGCTIPRSEHEG